MHEQSVLHWRLLSKSETPSNFDAEFWIKSLTSQNGAMYTCHTLLTKYMLIKGIVIAPTNLTGDYLAMFL